MITDVRFTPASDRDLERGLLAYVSFDYGQVHVDGVTLRRTRDDRVALSWPERRDRQGRRHPLIRPLDDRAREDLEAAVLSELRRQEAAR